MAKPQIILNTFCESLCLIELFFSETMERILFIYIFMFFFEVFLVLVIFWKSCVFSRKKQFSNQKTPEKNTLFLNILQTSSEVVCFAN